MNLLCLDLELRLSSLQLVGCGVVDQGGLYFLDVGSLVELGREYRLDLQAILLVVPPVHGARDDVDLHDLPHLAVAKLQLVQIVPAAFAVQNVAEEPQTVGQLANGCRDVAVAKIGRQPGDGAAAVEKDRRVPFSRLVSPRAVPVLAVPRVAPELELVVGQDAHINGGLVEDIHDLIKSRHFCLLWLAVRFTLPINRNGIIT